MRAPIQPQVTISRLFSTHQNPKSASLGGPTRLQPVQTLAAAGRLREAIRLLVVRRHLGLPVHPDAFVAILRPCAALENLMDGRQLHGHMVVSGFDRDPFICNHLINMYGNCGYLDDAHSVFRGLAKKKLHSWNTMIACYCKFGPLCEARRLFDEMPKRDAVSWNTMISGYDKHGPYEEALKIFVRMRHSECQVDHYGLSSVISACSSLRFLRNGEELHGYSFNIGLDSHVEVGSALIGLYAKCWDVECARRVFDGMGLRELHTWNSMLQGYVQCSRINEAVIFFREMPRKNVVSWTTIVAGCSQHERYEEAIDFFHKLWEVGLRPDQVSFVSALNACVGILDFEEGFKIHAQTLKCGVEADVFVGSALVSLYAKCGYLDDAKSVPNCMHFVDDFSWSVLIAEYLKHGLVDSAREVFQNLEAKSIPLWNALICGYSDLGLDEEAFEAYKEMQVDGKMGDEFTFGSLLMGAGLLGLRYGEQLHLQTIKVGIDSFVFVGSALVNLYCYNVDCQAAMKVFNSIQKPNLVVWNAMISGYELNNFDLEAAHTFALMMAQGIEPDNVTLSLVLDLCSKLRAQHGGTQVHALAYKLGFESDVVVGSALVDVYAKCENMDSASRTFRDIHRHNVVSWTTLLGVYMRFRMWDAAKELFDMMPERNVVSWNTMLSGYAKYGFELEAIRVYNQMNKSGPLPDWISFVTVLTICCRLLLEEPAKQVHAQIVKSGYHKNAHINSLLIHMYQQLGTNSDKIVPCSTSIDPNHGNSVDGAEPDAVSGNT